MVADIHFDYRLALESIKSGADKIPVKSQETLKESMLKKLFKHAKKKQIPIRIGVNSGSLELSLTPELMVEVAKSHVDILESMDFYDIALSLKDIVRF